MSLDPLATDFQSDPTYGNFSMKRFTGVLLIFSFVAWLDVVRAQNQRDDTKPEGKKGATESVGFLDFQRPGTRPSPDSRPVRITNPAARTIQWQRRRDQVRNGFWKRHPRMEFWKSHPHLARWQLSRPMRTATWPAVTRWLSWNASQPAYNYDYGTYIFYDGDTVHYAGGATLAAVTYAQQAQDLATSGADVRTDQSRWMSLGIFAVTQERGSTSVDPAVYIQFVLSKEGAIEGTVTNIDTQKTATIEGMVHPTLQRAAWVITGSSSPVMETGISNLTKDAAPALLHLSDGQTQQRLLIRLNDPHAPKPRPAPPRPPVRIRTFVPRTG
jgi:hypothetical protein